MLDRSRILVFFLVAVVAGAAAMGCGSATLPIGDPCATKDACGGEEYCDTASPGGECSAICEEGDDLDDCGAGNVCAEISVDSWECKKGCTSDAQCRSGFVCQGAQGSAKYCVPQ